MKFNSLEDTRRISPIISILNSKKKGEDFDKIIPIRNNIEKIFLKKENLNIFNNKIYVDKIISIIDTTRFKNFSNNYNNILTPIFGNYGVSIGLNDYTGMITAETLAPLVYPIVEYIHTFQPDYIVASDRGARLLGFAVKIMYQKLYGKLPTFDGTLRFRKISRKLPESHNRDILAGVVKETLTHGKYGRILFLDDWIASGGTQDIVNRLVSELSQGRIDLKYGVLVGSGADVTGNKKSGIGTVDWHDDADKIGVDYDSSTNPVVVGSKESKVYRERLIEGIDNFLETLDAGKNYPNKESKGYSITGVRI